MNFSQLMPNGTIKNGTICMYNITSSRKLYRTFTFTVDTAVTLLLTQSKDGVQTTLTPNSNRNLLSSERKLSSVSNSYTVAGADFVLMSYQTASDSTGFVSTVGPDQTPSSSKDFALIIAVICSVFGLIAVYFAIIGTLLCLCRRKIFRRTKTIKERNETYKINNPDSKLEINLNLNNFSNNVLLVNTKDNKNSTRNSNKEASSLKNKNDEENCIQIVSKNKENFTQKVEEQSKNCLSRKSIVASVEKFVINCDEESMSELAKPSLSFFDESTNKFNTYAIYQENADIQNDSDIIKIPSCSIYITKHDLEKMSVMKPNKDS